MYRMLEQTVKRGVEMIGRLYVCDVCRKEFKYEVAQTPLGNKIHIIHGLGTTKVWNTEGLFQHLCKECALMIDNELLKAKLEILTEVQNER